MMDRAAASAAPSHENVVFSDGLGERRRVLDPSGRQSLEILFLRKELTAIPSFEFALRERVTRLAGFRHPYFAPVRSVDRVTDNAASLAIVSEAPEGGVRLSEVLAVAEERRLSLDISAALCLIRQLIPALAILHQTGRDIAHGAIAPERVVITPSARLVIMEDALGAALEQLRYPQERFWRELSVAVPRSAGLPRFSHRTDVAQAGVVALALILGRRIRNDEYPSGVPALVSSAWAISGRGGLEPLPPGLRSWLARALQLDVRASFASALEAQAEFEKVLSDSDYSAPPTALESFLRRCRESVESTAVPLESPHQETGPASAPQPPPLPSRTPPRSVSAAPAPPAPQPPSSHQLEPAVLVASGRDIHPAVPALDPPRAVASDAAPMAALRKPPADSVVSVQLPISLGEFTPEEDVQAYDDEGVEPERSRPRRWFILGAAAVVLMLAVGGAMSMRHTTAPAPAPKTGTVVVNTNPPGATIAVDGAERGSSPLTLTLDAGSHVLEAHGSGEPRSVTLTVVAGSQVSQFIELPHSAPVGRLQVRTDPPGAKVIVDGVERGTSPLTLDDVAVGGHAVRLDGGLGSVTQNVTIAAGATASLVVPLAAPEGTPVSGWISASAPVDMQLFEKGQLLGTSQSDRIMVSTGKHDITIVNETLGYRAVKSVTVAAGKVTAIKADWPNGTIALNAVPWADVSIDGASVGQTPLGNLSVPIGPHEIVFRHPELGERRQAITVTMKEPVRVSIDMRKP
jgi:serine/threonine protein kinase